MRADLIRSTFKGQDFLPIDAGERRQESPCGVGKAGHYGLCRLVPYCLPSLTNILACADCVLRRQYSGTQQLVSDARVKRMVAHIGHLRQETESLADAAAPTVTGEDAVQVEIGRDHLDVHQAIRTHQILGKTAPGTPTAASLQMGDCAQTLMCISACAKSRQEHQSGDDHKSHAGARGEERLWADDGHRA